MARTLHLHRVSLLAAHGPWCRDGSTCRRQCASRGAGCRRWSLAWAQPRQPWRTARLRRWENLHAQDSNPGPTATAERLPRATARQVRPFGGI